MADTPENRKRAKKELIPKLLQLGEKVDTKIYVKKVEYYARLFFKNKPELKRATVERYTVEVNRILKRFGRYPVDEVKISQIREFLSELTPATKEACAKVFRGIMQEALYDMAINDNPFKFIAVKKARAKQAKPFGKDEIERLIDNADGWFKNFLAVAFYTGMRTGELIAVRWECVDWENGLIEVNATKRKGEIGETKTEAGNRRIPIFNPLMPYLKEQYRLTGQQNGFVFLNEDGKEFYSYQSIRQSQWVRLLKKLELDYRRLYDTRSSFATMLLSSGKYSVNQVAAMMGHAGAGVLFSKYNKIIKSEMMQVDRDL